MSHYKHLTRTERENLLFYLAKGYSVTKIAKELGRSKATISRELRRNTSHGRYLPSIAEARYQKRRKKCRRKKLLEDVELRAFVQDKFLNHHWSPEQIVGRLKLENSPYRISCRTIYRGIYSGIFDIPRSTDQAATAAPDGSCGIGGNPGIAKAARISGENWRSSMISTSDRRPPTRAHGSATGRTVIGESGGACLLTLMDQRSRFLLYQKCPGGEAKKWLRRWYPLCGDIRSKPSRLTGAKSFFVTPGSRKNCMVYRFILHCRIIPGSGARTRIRMDFFVNFFQKVLAWQTLRPRPYRLWKTSSTAVQERCWGLELTLRSIFLLCCT